MAVAVLLTLMLTLSMIVAASGVFELCNALPFPIDVGVIKFTMLVEFREDLNGILLASNYLSNDDCFFRDLAIVVSFLDFSPLLGESSTDARSVKSLNLILVGVISNDILLFCSLLWLRPSNFDFDRLVVVCETASLVTKG